MSSTVLLRNKKRFDDTSCSSLCIGSTWLHASATIAKKSVHVQTPSEFHNLQEREVQSGRYTRIIQDQITAEDAGVSVIDHLSKKHSRLWGQQPVELIQELWRDKVESGFVTVDCEVATEADMKVDVDTFVEFVDFKAHASTQTDFSANKTFLAEPKGDSKSESKDAKADAKKDKSRLGLKQFLDRVFPLVLGALSENETSSIFDNVEKTGSSQDNEMQTLFPWKLLSVDLEKKRVIYPDWNKARYHSGVVINCISTRNKERVYDVEFDDGGKLLNVREDYIRMLEDDSNSRSKTKTENLKRSQMHPARFQEGVRVHARVLTKGGYKYLPGRIVKLARNTFDVECEGGKVETGLTVDDLCVGLMEGQRVEARRPQKIQLQCTGLSWNSTGSMLACAFGKHDVLGWCNFPGAICIWNIFGKEFDAVNPDFVFDHPSCIMSVAYHPVAPSVIAAGSYNGEVIIWDLAAYENNCVAISPITEYSHKDPIVSLRWVFNSQVGSDNWWLVTVSTDGKVLFWSLANKLQHPMKGYFLHKAKSSSLRTNKNNVLGACSFAFSCGLNSVKQVKPKWIVVGHVGGSICRAQVSKLGGNPLNAEMLKLNPNTDDVYGPLQRLDDAFSHDSHVGAVTSIDWSPFHRNLFLCAGMDGKVKLFHVLEPTPIKLWEPFHHLPNALNDIGMSSVTGVAFSPVRPLIFAVACSNGYVMLFDLSDATGKPVAIHFIDSQQEVISAIADEEKIKDLKKGQRSGKSSGVCLTGLAFNHKQRDLLSVGDWSGKVHIFKLSWKLSNRQSDEQNHLEEIGNLSTYYDES